MMVWPSRALGELATITRGSSPRPIADTRYFEGGTIPWIKIADATKSGKFLYETKEHVNQYGASFSKILPAGTILVAASGTLGYTQILGVEGCAHDGWLILQNLNGLDRDFAYYALKTVERHFFNSASGAAIQNINTDILRKTEITCPPLPMQQHIAGILSAYDELIENNQRRIRILEDMARSLYREWFIHFRYPGHESVPLVDSPLGQIPQGWEVKKIAELLAKVSRQGKIKTQDYLQAGELPVIDQGRELVGGYTNDADVEYSGELPVIVFGDHTRILKFIDFPFACGADGTQLLRSNDERMPVSLFYYTLSAIELSDFAYARHFKFLKEELVVVPIAEVATAFSERVNPIKRQVRVLQQQSDNLRRTRDLLLPRLLSGNLKLECDEEEVLA